MYSSTVRTWAWVTLAMVGAHAPPAADRVDRHDVHVLPGGHRDAATGAAGLPGTARCTARVMSSSAGPGAVAGIPRRPRSPRRGRSRSGSSGPRRRVPGGRLADEHRAPRTPRPATVAPIMLGHFGTAAPGRPARWRPWRPPNPSTWRPSRRQGRRLLSTAIPRLPGWASTCGRTFSSRWRVAAPSRAGSPVSVSRTCMVVTPEPRGARLRSVKHQGHRRTRAGPVAGGYRGAGEAQRDVRGGRPRGRRVEPGQGVLPEDGNTKLDLVRYYLSVAEGALRGVAGARWC